MSDENPQESAQDKALEAESIRLSALAQSDDWKLAKTKLLENIRLATSLLDMPKEDRRDQQLLEARYQAAQIVGSWIAEVEGSALLHDKIEDTQGDQPHVLRIG